MGKCNYFGGTFGFTHNIANFDVLQGSLGTRKIIGHFLKGGVENTCFFPSVIHI
jgi:hypothetical protein